MAISGAKHKRGTFGLRRTARTGASESLTNGIRGSFAPGLECWYRTGFISRRDISSGAFPPARILSRQWERGWRHAGASLRPVLAGLRYRHFLENRLLSCGHVSGRCLGWGASRGFGWLVPGRDAWESVRLREYSRSNASEGVTTLILAMGMERP